MQEAVPGNGNAANGGPSHESGAAAICRRHGDDPGALIEIFHDLQDEIGWVPDETLPVIAKALNLSRADVYGVLTFYHDFRREPAGRHVLKLCRAEACQSMGAERLIAGVTRALGVQVGATAKDGSLAIEAVYCLGNCALSPAAMLDGRLIGRADERKLTTLVAAALRSKA